MATKNYYSVGGKILGHKAQGQPRVDYLTDALGSVTATVDQSATVQGRKRYKPYGATLAANGTSASQVFQWSGFYYGVFHWKLSNRPSEDGWFVQKLTVYGAVTDCSKPPQDLHANCLNPSAGESGASFWEAWRVSAENNTGDDTARFDSFVQMKSKGNMGQYGEIKFYYNQALLHECLKRLRRRAGIRLNV